ncbi:MAG: class I SAM-dependent methyltransferase [Gemmatimonadaceae bacterium]
MHRKDSAIYESYERSGYGGYANPIASSETWAQYATNHTRYLPAERSATILDVGCGAGHFLSWLRASGYVSARGVDLSENAVRYCVQQGLAAEHVQDVREYLDACPQTFDLVTMNDVIEHFIYDDVVDILRLCRGSLRPAGHLLVKTINMANRGGLYLRYADFTHRVGFTETSLRQVLLAAGFQTVSVEPYRVPSGGIRRSVWRIAGRVLHQFRRAKLFVDLGADTPRILSKTLFAVANT